jgi:hypothetical protein
MAQACSANNNTVLFLFTLAGPIDWEINAETDYGHCSCVPVLS